MIACRDGSGFMVGCVGDTSTAPRSRGFTDAQLEALSWVARQEGRTGAWAPKGLGTSCRALAKRGIFDRHDNGSYSLTECGRALVKALGL